MRWMLLIMVLLGVASAVIVHTVRQSEPLTELYFASPGITGEYLHLGARVHEEIVPGEPVPTVSIVFRIHNLASQNSTYPYEVSVENATNTTTVASGSVSVLYDETADVGAEIPITLLQSRSHLLVTLLNTQQHIALWVEP